MQEVLPHFGYSLNVCFYRNAIFTGFPFFMIGHLFRMRDEQNEKRYKTLVWIVLVAGIIGTAFEQTINPSQRVYVGTIFLSVAVFYLGITLNSKESVLVKFGRDGTLVFYIIHPAIGMILRDYCMVNGYLLTLVTIVLTTAFSIAWSIIQKKVRIHS